MTVDRILIEGLLVRCIIGINDHERRERQDVIISIALSADIKKACSSDRVEDTVDYKALKKEVMAYAESSNFFLIEALAEAIADICLARPLVKEAKVRVDKPAALRFSKSVAVEITRTRG